MHGERMQHTRRRRTKLVKEGSVINTLIVRAPVTHALLALSNDFVELEGIKSHTTPLVATRLTSHRK